MYKWDEKYCIGEPQIDSQHRKLFQICERIMKIFEYHDDAKNQRAVVEAIKFLKNYTIEHFASEEAYQRAIGYDGYEEHHEKHEEFTQTILEQEKLLEESGYAFEDVERFIEIVNNWLAEHIMCCDHTIVPGK